MIKTIEREDASGRLDILCFHRITSGDERYFIPPMALKAKTFERIVHCLASDGLLIPLKQGVGELALGKLTGRRVALSFDDGYLDNFTIARKILKRYKATATFFVPTKPLDEQQPFWWDYVWNVVKHQPKRFHNWFSAIGHKILLATNNTSPYIRDFITSGSDCRTLVQALNANSKQARDCFILGLSEEFGKYIGPRLLMDWGEVGTLVDDGFEIGAHCVNHEPLTEMSLDDAAEDIRSSRAILKQRVGITPAGFSFPRGDYNNALLQIVEMAGYDYSVTTQYGTNSSFERYALRRRNISDYVDFRKYLPVPFQMLEISGRLDSVLVNRRSKV